MSNFLSLLSVFSLLLMATGCQNLLSRGQSSPAGGAGVHSPVGGESSTTGDIATPSHRPPPKIGLILSAGGAKAFAHVGVLKAFENAKIPVQSVVGIEWGAMVASLYGIKGSANDLEWQLFKLKDGDVLDSGLLSSSDEAQSTTKLKDYLSKTIGQARFEEMQLKVACPTKSILTEALFWMNRGPVETSLRMCLSFPPYFTPTKNRVAAVDSVNEAADYLKRNGADLVIFVNVLEAGPLFTRLTSGDHAQTAIIWSQLRKSYQRPSDLVDGNIGVYLADVGVDEFAKRREAVVAGTAAAKDLIQRLLESYDF